MSTCCKCGCIRFYQHSSLKKFKFWENALILGDIARTMNFYVRGFIMHSVYS